MSPVLKRTLALGALGVVFAAALASRAEADLWGHVRFGMDTLIARHLTAVDPYSFTQDTPWINHEWLSEVQMGAAYMAAGPAGLQILKAAIISIVTALIWGALAGARLGVRLSVFLVVFIGTIHMWATIRPQLWSLLCLAILCRILMSGSRRLLWLVPPIFAIWANCHGGWVVGLGVLGAWAAASVAMRPVEWRTWAVVAPGAMAATLCNPYGWHLWEFVLRTVRVSRAIEEWQPLTSAPALNWLPWAIAFLSMLWIVAARRTGRWLPTALALTMLAYGAVRVQRIESLFVVAAAILAAPWIAAQWPAESRAETRANGAARLLAAAAVTGACVIAGWLGARSWGCISIFGDWAPDQTTAQLLEGAEPGRLVTFFDWGEYAIWRFGPRLKVSIDGRRETVYSDERIAENDAVVAGTERGLAVLDAWRPDYVWLPARSAATKAWLRGHGYRIESDRAQSFLAVRSDLPTLPRGAASASRPSCFPN